MAKKFAEHNGLNLTQVNSDILELWNKKDVFHKSIEERDGCPQFVFFEGPPSANGHPGIHHVLAQIHNSLRHFLSPRRSLRKLSKSLSSPFIKSPPIKTVSLSAT